MSTTYIDSRVSCNDAGIEVRGYYFPFAARKWIPWRSVARVTRLDMGASIWWGRWRIWGSGDLRHWFPLDVRRPRKRWAFVIELADQWVRPVVTPDDPELFARCLEVHGRVAEPDRPHV